MDFASIRKDVLGYVKKYPDRFNLFQEIAGADEIAAKKDGHKSTIFAVFFEFVNNGQTSPEIVNAIGISEVDEKRVEREILTALYLIGFELPNGDYTEEIKTEVDNLRRRSSSLFSFVIEHEQPSEIESDISSPPTPVPISSEKAPEISEGIPPKSAAYLPDRVEIGYVFPEIKMPAFLQMPTAESVRAIEKALADSEKKLEAIKKVLKEEESECGFLKEMLGVHKAFSVPSK